MIKHHYIVIPCFNEEFRLKSKSFINFTKANLAIKIIFVDDGSTDNTICKLNNIIKHNTSSFHIVKLSQNLGKSEAVRLGINYALNQEDLLSVGFLDADLSTSLTEYARMINMFDFDKQKLLFVMGVRLLKNQNIIYQKHRIYARKIFNYCLQLLLNIKYEDTQCGAKVFSKKIASKIFEDEFKTIWLFDVELILRYEALYGKKKIVEYELFEWEQKEGTKITLIEKLKMPFQLIKIKLWSILYYFNSKNKNL